MGFTSYRVFGVGDIISKDMISVDMISADVRSTACKMKIRMHRSLEIQICTYQNYVMSMKHIQSKAYEKNVARV